MIDFIWALAVHARHYLRGYMPTNVLLDALRTRRGLKWGIIAMPLAVPYLFAARMITVMIDNGAPGWMHLFVLMCIWNALKFLWNGPVSLANLRRARANERRRIDLHPAFRT